jgi:peptidoglycan/LPS O-acetylase OafA/YrhL
MWDKEGLKSNNFAVMRFVAAVLVIFSHSFPLLSGKESIESGDPLLRMTRGAETFGSASVAVFFTISGFLIMLSYERSSGCWTFIKKRIARILPAYLVASLIGALIVAPFFTASGKPWFVWSKLIKDLVRLRHYTLPWIFSSNPFPGQLNGSLWTISYEFWCYIILGLLGIAGLTRRKWPILLIFALLAIANALHLQLPNFAHFEMLFGGSFRVDQIRNLFLCWSNVLSLQAADSS